MSEAKQNAPAMKRIYVAAINPEEEFSDIFRVVEMRLAPYRDEAKGHYLNLALADRSGQIDARLWEGAEEAAGWLHPGDVVTVAARSTLYQNRIRLRIESIEPAEDGDYDLAELLPQPDSQMADAVAALNAAAGQIGSLHMRRLVESFLGDTDLVTAFCQSPPARPGQTLHGVVRTLELATPLLGLEGLDDDLLLAAILLYETGKAAALMLPKGGQALALLGEAVLTDQLVSERLAQLPDFPPDSALALRHCLLAMHNATAPRSREAAALVQLKGLQGVLMA